MARNTVKIRILDEVYVAFVGLRENDNNWLYEKYGMHTANYFFSPKFKCGQWDGKIRFYQKTGKTYLYLIDEILPQLQAWGYDLVLEDLRTAEPRFPEFVHKDIFADHLHEVKGELVPIELRDYQVDAVNELLQYGNGMIIAATGAGKAQPLTSKVHTPNGWIAMGNVKVGTVITTPTGGTADVIGVFPQGQKQVYRVTFHDGSETVCCDEHLWKVNIPTKLHTAKTEERVVSLSTIRAFLERKNSGVYTPGNVSVNTIQPVEYYNPPSPALHPYLLGVLLGDGRLSGGSVMVSTADDHIKERVSELVREYDITAKYVGRGVDYRLSHKERSNKPNRLVVELAKLNLVGKRSHEKFIPELYKTTSVDDRWELIRGLMDTDGTVDRRGNVSFSTTSEVLAKDVQYILWSLGATATITYRTTKYKYNGVDKTGRVSYTVHASCKERSNMFSLPRKKERCQALGSRRISHARRIAKVEPLGVMETQCIAVNSDDHLYITDDFIVTHNTLMTAALVYAWEQVGYKTITIVPDESLIIQTKGKFVQCGLDTGEYSGNLKDTGHAHVVSTWQAIQHNFKIIQLFDVIVVDEAHGARGEVLQKILNEYAANIPNRFGVTGTLPKPPSERMTVLAALGPVRYTISADQLIEAGVLADLHIDVVQLEEDLEEQYKQFLTEPMLGEPPTYIQFKDAYFPDFTSEKTYLHRKQDRIEFISHMIQVSRDKAKGNVLCLVDSIPFGRRLAETIPNAIFVNGQDVKKAKNRKEIYDLFKTHDDLVVIATVHIAGTGLDIPRIFTLFFIDIGKSFIRVIQSIGRGLRKAHDKDKVLVVDISSDLKYGKRHTTSRVKYYKEAKYPYKRRKVKYADLTNKG